MMSVNQMAIYHTLIEAFNVVRNQSSEDIQTKWTQVKKPYSFRNSEDLKVPKKPNLNCKGFTYTGSKLFNMLPKSIRETENPKTFKTLTKRWIWDKIPSQQSAIILS